MDLNHPLVQSLLAPLAASLLSAALLRGRLQGACVGVAVLACLLLLRGLAWPPASGIDKLAWAVLAALALGLLVDALDLGAGRRLRGGLLALPLVAALLWLAAPQLSRPDLVLLIEVTLLVALGTLAMLRLYQAGARSTVSSAILGVLAAGTALVAFNGGSLVLAQASGALAVGAGVHVLLGWFGASSRSGASAALAGAGGWVLLLALLTLLTDVSRWALAVLPLALFAEPLSRRLPGAGGGHARILASLWACAVAALPVALAVFLSTQAGVGADDLYYQ